MKLSFDNFPIMLAPMAGVTDVGFRAVSSAFGADATVTEMLSVRAMAHNPQKTQFMTLTTADERTKIAQIFGHEPEYIAQAVTSEMLAKFDGIDINMGCPAPKIIKNGEGAALMDNLPLASKIISETAKNSGGRPVSVKFRKGNKTQNFLEFAKMCEESGASFVTFHARTVEQGYSGQADYDAIASVKAKLSIPVVGNGDVVNEKSLENMKSTGVNGVMIGRGALGRPWIFAELKENFHISPEERIDAVKKHISLLRENFAENWIKLYIRKHLLWYANGLFLASNLRQTLATCEDVDECIKILEEAFLQNP